MTLQEITLELRIVDITAIHDCLRQKRNLCSPLRIIIRINMPFFISYDSLFTKLELTMNPSLSFSGYSLKNSANGIFNVFHSINRPLTDYFIMLKTDRFPYFNILVFLCFYRHSALPWNNHHLQFITSSPCVFYNYFFIYFLTKYFYIKFSNCVWLNRYGIHLVLRHLKWSQLHYTKLCLV